MPAEKILVVDDEQSMTQFLGIVLRKEGYQVTVSGNGRDALEKVRAEGFDVVITDLRMPGMDGIALLEGIKKHDPTIPVVIMTAYASQQTAIDAVNLGAFQYLIKNAKNDEIKLVVRNAAEMRRVRSENQFLKRELKKGHEEKTIIGSSDEMARVFRMVEKVADSEATILISGDSGTGKELIAREIHYRSRRSGGPFVSINCGAIPRDLLESNLFGHVKGSFTGAVRDSAGLLQVAESGTFFLDEVGETPSATQVKLLRALQEREIIPVGGTQPVKIDCRLVAATNADLEKEVAEGRFRADLFYRLNVIPIRLPSLRQRRDDIPLLVDHFLRRFAQNNPAKTVSAEAMDLLMKYDWPGNVRELENRVQRAVILAQDASVRPQDLELGTEREEGPQSLQEARDEAERRLLTEALTRNAGNITRAARDIKVSRPTLHDLLRKHAMDAARFRRPDVPGAAEEDEDAPDAAGEDRP